MLAPSVTTTLIAPRTIETLTIGRIRKSSCEKAQPEFMRLLQTAPNLRWVVNIIGMDGFDADSVPYGVTWFNAYMKASTERELIFVSKQGPIRMLAHSLAFAAGLKVRPYETPEEAYRYLGLEGPTLHAEKRR